MESSLELNLINTLSVVSSGYVGIKVVIELDTGTLTVKLKDPEGTFYVSAWRKYVTIKFLIHYT